MNRLDWITYLKILFDQLEKVKEIEHSNNSSFLSINTNKNKKRKRKFKIEKVDRTVFVRALNKIKALLPMMKEDEYMHKFPNEKSISLV